MVFYLGFFGLGESTSSSSYWAALVDLEQLRLVEQISSTATGTDRGVGLFYGLFIASDTRGGAQKGLVRDLVAGIAGVRPAGPVRIVLLASEAIRSPRTSRPRNVQNGRPGRSTRDRWTPTRCSPSRNRPRRTKG
jgi:hypothetical protein